MSFRSASIQKRLKDDQFVGDLISLFERRKIKTGDPCSLDTFDSILASNDAFRSQLFTLCTAISHMSAEDLSGEQLLALVARALGGSTVCSDDGTVSVPDSMRSAFLTGYEAWSNRASEPKEPLPWPIPTQSQQREESEPTPPLTGAEPAAPRPAAPGLHTLQEALDIARERALADPSARPSPRPETNTEGLTLSELKTLLAEIENRVNRLQPHLGDLTAAAHSPVDVFRRREQMHQIDAALPLSSSLPAVQPEPLQAADTATAQTTHRTSRPARLNEAAFLARHSYLRPARQVTDTHSAGATLSSATPQTAATLVPISAAPAFAVAAAPAIVAPATAPESAAASAPLSEPSQPAAAATISSPPVFVAPNPPIAAAQPVAAPVPPAPALVQIVPARPDPPRYIPFDDEPASLAIGRIRVTPGMAAGILIGFAAFIVVVSGLAGLFIYPSLHPKTLNDYPDLKQGAAQTQTSPGDAASGGQVILASPDDPLMNPPAPQAARGAARGASKTHAKPATPPVAVWPYTNQAASRDASPPIAPSLPSGSTAARRPSPQAPPLYVPSTALISSALSAPQPAYPRDQPRGINGTVVVQITVSRDGYVTDIRVVSGPVEMRSATVQAVQAWRFRPYLVNGSAVEVTTTLGFLFKGQ